jgi:hypothetical protein
LIFAKRPFSSLLLVDVEAFAFPFWLFFFDPTFVSNLVEPFTSSAFGIVLKEILGNRDINA